MIDTHCHLYDTRAFEDPAEFVERAQLAGVERLVVVGIDPETSLQAIALADRFEAVFAVVGTHPNSASTFQRDHLRQYAELWRHPKVVAIGEIGLDFHWDFATLDQQLVALEAQMDLALELAAPVVFHCREAYPTLLSFLEQRPHHPYLFHCFAGDAADAQRVQAMDGFIGVDGPITYKRADELRAVVRSFAPDRIVIETDAPYLTPEPHRGKRNEPAYVGHVLARLATEFGDEIEEMDRKTTASAKAIFRKLF